MVKQVARRKEREQGVEWRRVLFNINCLIIVSLNVHEGENETCESASQRQGKFI